MKKIKHQNLLNREVMCFNCCNVYAPNLKECPVCQEEGGMLINKDNRTAMQIRHMIMRDPLPVIPFEALADMIRRENEKFQKGLNTVNKIFHYIAAAVQFFSREEKT